MDENSLLVLPWGDILFRYVFTRLNLKELFLLRSVSRDFKQCIERYFEVYCTLNLAIYKKFDKEAFKVLLLCRSVKYLNISKCNWLTDELLSYFFQNNTNIVEINLSYCNNIFIKSLQILILNCKQLKCLRMASCCWLTTGALDAITYHQKNLHTVDFSKCLLLNERSIMKFVVKFNQLKILSLAWIPISDSTIIAIAYHCHNLENLNVTGTNVSNTAVRMLLSSCKKLESVKLSNLLLTRETMPYY